MSSLENDFSLGAASVKEKWQGHSLSGLLGSTNRVSGGSSGTISLPCLSARSEDANPLPLCGFRPTGQQLMEKILTFTRLLVKTLCWLSAGTPS